MKTKIVLPLIVILLSLSDQAMAQSTLRHSAQCARRGLLMAARVKIVEEGEDLRVKDSQASKCARIKWVQSAPAACGEWQVVQSGEDMKIKFVEAGQNFCVRIVNP